MAYVLDARGRDLRVGDRVWVIDRFENGAIRHAKILEVYQNGTVRASDGYSVWRKLSAKSVVRAELEDLIRAKR